MRKYLIQIGGRIVSIVTIFLIGFQFAFADTCGTTNTFQASQGLRGLICFAASLLRLVIPLLVGVALIMFIYGIIIYVINANSDDKRKEGTKSMLMGIIGLFVMISVWGLVKVLGSTFGLDNTIPQLGS